MKSSAATTFVLYFSICFSHLISEHAVAASPKRFTTLQAEPYLTSKTSNFGSNIEGLSVNPSGEIYAVNYGNSSTTHQLGQVYPTQRLFYKDQIRSSKFNGMAFMSNKLAFAVDQNASRVLRLDLDGAGSVIRSSVHCAHPNMIPLNDLALSFKSGLIFLSAMNWLPNTTNTDGQIWVCFPNPAKRPVKLHTMGRINGIELSPDEKTLYATEGYTRQFKHIGQKIWKFNVDLSTGRLSSKKLFVDFAALKDDPVQADLDGLKTDVQGNLLAVRYGSSSVSVFSESGTPKSKIRLNFPNPTNLQLAKVGSKSVLFVCGKCNNDHSKGCVDVVEWPWIGRSVQQFRKNKTHKNPFLGYRDSSEET